MIPEEGGTVTYVFRSLKKSCVSLGADSLSLAHVRPYVQHGGAQNLHKFIFGAVKGPIVFDKRLDTLRVEHREPW